MKSTETSHFWAGKFATLESFTDLFVETYGDDDDTPISQFAATQNETFYDHDFIEYGYSSEPETLPEFVENYSYSDQWLNEFAAMVESNGLADINAFVFISDSEISDPQSFENENGYLRYLGKLTYTI